MASEEDRPDGTRCGFVALIGAPNAGKSTLINRLVGSKVSIVSPKVQTTRCRVAGIAIEGAAQIVFVDTPGIFRPRRRLDRAMVDRAWREVGDADIVALLIDAAAGLGSGSEAILDRLGETGRADVLLLNKVDATRRPKLLELAQAVTERCPFRATFMISALTGDGVPDFVAWVAERLPAGPWLFPEDQISDLPMRLLAAEITREQLYLQLQDELPYASAVDTESWEQFENGDVRIRQVVYVERDSQKAIVLGKGGRRIKAIGAAARIELEKLLEARVHLFLHLKVRERWGEDPEHYRSLGLSYNV